MNQQIKEIRTYQIAALAILRYWKDCEIELIQSSYYEFIVTFKESNMVVGIKVMNTGFLRTKHYQYYINTFSKYDVISQVNKMPILLLSVNEEEEHVQIGIILGWQYGIPKLYFKPHMRELTQTNSDKILDEIKLMDDTIRLLSIHGMRVIKTIEITHANYNIGKVVYLRNFTDEYKMKTKKVISEKERFNRNLIGVPESEYPEDFLDKIIFQMIQRQFPNSIKSSQLLLFSTDLRKLQLLSRKALKIIQCNIIIEASEISQNILLQEILKPLSFTLDVFINDYRKENVFKNLSLKNKVPLNELYNTQQEYSKALLTLDSPRNFFIEW